MLEPADRLGREPLDHFDSPRPRHERGPRLVLPHVAGQARELVRRSGVGYSSLRAAFKQAQGATLKEFLTRTRLDAARLRLGDPRLTIKEVARTLDFSSEHYFSHFFRRHTGLTPSQYRNRGAAQRS